MIFRVKSIVYSETENWNKFVRIKLTDDKNNEITLSSGPSDTVVCIELSNPLYVVTCLKKDFSYFNLPEQMVLKISSSLHHSGMNGEPIVLDIPAGTDTEMLVKAFKVLTLH